MLLLVLVLAYVGSVWASGDAPNINYSHNMRILKLPSNTAVGALIYRLKGSDPDSEKLTFGTTDPVASRLLRFTSLSFREADVYLMSPLSVSHRFPATHTSICSLLIFLRRS